jgi:prenyltransferase beta subunit
MPNAVCYSLQIFDALVMKVDIALQSIKQTSYKGTIDWKKQCFSKSGHWSACAKTSKQNPPFCCVSTIYVFRIRSQYDLCNTLLCSVGQIHSRF